jgi:hypothetical protein
VSALRITLRRGGGFAGPAATRTVTLDASRLSAADRTSLDRAMTAAHVDSLPARVASPRAMPDRRQYELTITTVSGTRTTLVDEPAAPQPLLDLFDLIERLAASSANDAAADSRG